MKRKSGRKPTKKEEENSNGVESRSEQNGDTSDHDEDDTPKNKKRKSSKWNRKSVSFSSKKEEAAAESEKSEDQDHDDDQKEDKKSSKSSRKSKQDEEESRSDNDEDVPQKKKTLKKGKNTSLKDDKEKKPDSSDEDEDDESQYEVESVLDEKMIKGVRHYLIRWKGYEEESDTWEPENTLDCDRLIQEFKDKKKKNRGKPKKLSRKEKKESEGAEWDENEDFEVDRILEVHHRKDGKKEFLVSWKGYSSTENSWEPEENMDCKDLIAKFMAKVDKARQLGGRELRVHRPHVQRYTLSTQDSERRLSKRFRGKERVQYHDAE